MKDLNQIITITKTLKLLYVEDDKEIRESTLKILNDFFTDIVVAVDGEDGLEKFYAHKIDVIITDIAMPKKSGLDMLETIYETDKDVIFLIFSAYNEEKYFMKSIRLGVESYFLKPIEFEQFLQVIERIAHKTEALKANQQLQQYKEIVDYSAIVSSITPDGKVKYVNDAFCTISGYTRKELIGKDYLQTTKNQQEKSINDSIWKCIKEEKSIWRGVTKNISKEGDIYYLDSTIKPILDKDEEIIEYMAVRYDITDVMNPLRQLNDFIKTTTLPMVILIKIENFQNIENFYGQDFLQDIEGNFAKQLLKFIPSEMGVKHIYILQNGEFAIAFDKTFCKRDDNEMSVLLQNLQLQIEDAHIHVGELDYDTSIGISYAYGEKVLENAKYGIKLLKETAKRVVFANNLADKQHRQAQENIRILKMVKTAIEEHKIISYFQPIIDNKTQEIVKYESLVRLINEDGKVLAPFFFLDVSKQGKYYTQITSMVLDNAFEALKVTDKDISINLSALDIEKEAIREKFFTLLQKNKDTAQRIVIELLEDEAFKDFETIKSFITKVKSMGVKIAIDDFGSGYSNFERLLDYQPDILKIDASLVKNIATSSFSLSTVKTMVIFAKEQNMQVIAEYVENEEIYNILCSLDVDFSQGYYFGKPDILQKK